MNISVKLRLTNRLTSSRTIVLEPWAGEYSLRPGKTFELVADGDPAFPLEIELLDDDTIVVNAFDSAGAMMAIYEAGRELKSQ